MGKQKQLKRLKRIAKQLPPEIETVQRIERVRGEEILAKGTKEIVIDGKAHRVEKSKDYTARFEVKRRVNHADKLKKAYKTGKVQAVANYVDKYLPK
jgi:hypothetical protein